MASAIACIRKEIHNFDEEFIIDPSTDAILKVEDNQDGTLTVIIVSYVRKGNGG